jgi:flagellar biosynthetic protein FliQ
MTPENIIDLFRNMLVNVMLIITIIAAPGLLVGLLVSVFQAATQINEQSLSFIPKLIVTFLTLIIAGPWLLHIIIDFANSIFLSIAEYME